LTLFVKKKKIKEREKGNIGCANTMGGTDELVVGDRKYSDVLTERGPKTFQRDGQGVPRNMD